MHNSEIRVALSKLNPISLDEIGSVKLMNRIEKKYVFTTGKLNDLINLLNGRYQVLEIENLRVLPYSTTYFDTCDYLFYYQHVRGEFDRYKIRYRKYDATDTSFLEIKKKTNKGRTIKWRIENKPFAGSFDNLAVSFLREHLPVDLILVKPVLLNHFSRATLIGFEPKERITIDFNITFSDPEKKIQVEMPYLAIVELKKEGYSEYSDFKNLIRQLNIYPTGFSKYCMGSAILNDSLKKNMIKQKLLLLNKIKNEHTRDSCN